ncbi:MAG: hypothetical protein IJS17_00325 [Clostridia bacterium]|nr:hypothetical protein [Clostridia bacterium]
MKKIICIALCLVMTAGLLTGCGSKSNTSQTGTNTKSSANIPALESAAMKTNLSQDEYTLYQNIFYNGQKNDFDKKSVKKEGTFATLHDAFNNVTRYYVWGYLDNTNCCDWQWELKFDNEENIPANGSYIEVEGVYEVSTDALDGLWIINPKVTVKESYADRGYDIDMCSMSDTLQYVEIQNIVNMADYFKDKTVCGYGRMESDSSIQDAYYDSKWSVEIETDSKIPAFGTIVVFTGLCDGGMIKDCKIYQNTQY